MNSKKHLHHEKFEHCPETTSEERDSEKNETKNSSGDVSRENTNTSESKERVELNALTDKMLRMQADFENFKKRSLRDNEETCRKARARIIDEILPIIDNFELGLKSAEADPKFVEGFQIILTQLKGVLERHGVSEIVADLQRFNPELHEAVAYIQHPEVKAEYVIETLRKGYLLDKKLLRPATVVVSKGQE